MTIPSTMSDELLTVLKPAQYLGGERGSITKDQSTVSLNICLAFPDTYEVGMSHTGYQILYDLLNRKEHFWAERAYCPLPDMEALLRSKGLPLASLEAKRPLSDFHVVGFSLQYELCISGILQMLDLGRIPTLSSERRDTDPLVIAGGPVAYHPEPLADFFDCFLIGDGEELLPEFLERYQEVLGLPREERLAELAKIQGVYVPRFFSPQYHEDGSYAGASPLAPYSSPSVQRRVLATLEGAPFPRNPIVPNIEAVHDRLAVEVMRGCVRGCRFCQAGYLYRPQRERAPEEIREIVRDSLANSGFEELSLLSLSTADYCSILPLLKVLKENFAEQDKLAISFPSTRVDALTPELLQEVQPVRRTGFTMAPEAGTQRLRDVINKGVTDDQIINTCKNVFTLGWSSVKLYFMIGLPTETDEDLMGIVDIGRRVKALAGRGKQVVISVSTHVPKPHTPFQWAEQISLEETKRRQNLLFHELKRSKITYRYHDPKATFLEGVFARGDRKLTPVILAAYRMGTRQDGWMEKLNLELWMKAFELHNIHPADYLRERDVTEPLPWDHIDCDIPKRWFEKEWRRATAARVTPDCLHVSCSSCGTCDYDNVRNVLFDRKRTESRLQIVSPPWQPIIDARENGATPEEILTKLTSKTPSGLSHNSNLQTSKANTGSYALREYLKTESNDGEIPPPDTSPKSRSLFRYRVQYSKVGPARFLGHLNLTTVFFRATRRGQIPVAFSRGFTPRPKFSFGPPLQLGLESDAEYFDLFLESSWEPETLRDRLNEVLPEGLAVLDLSPIPLNAPAIQAIPQVQNFQATLLSLPEALSSSLEERIKGWEERVISRKRKGRELLVPIRDYLEQVSCDGPTIRFSLKALRSGSTLKPLEALDALLSSGEVLAPHHSEFHVKKTGCTTFQWPEAEDEEQVFSDTRATRD